MNKDAPFRKNVEFPVRITDMSDGGLGIGKYEGFTWFVKDAVIGDLVTAHATEVKKNYGYARVSDVVEPSCLRVDPACACADACGGCQLMRLDYEAELRFKAGKVSDALTRIGGFDPGSFVNEPMIGAESPLRYRNKAIYPIGRNKEGRIISGFFAQRTHSIIERRDCLLEPCEFAGILKAVTEYMEKEHIEPYDEITHTGCVRHLMLRKGFESGEIMAVPVVNGGDPAWKRLAVPAPDKNSAPDHGAGFVGHILSTCSGVRSISICVNSNNGNVVMDGPVYDIYGPGHIEDTVGGIRFRISPLSFFQVNPVQMKRLYETVLEFAELNGTQNVCDLYCGVGSISLFLAGRARNVTAVEVVPEAIENARENACVNHIGNVTFFAGRAEEFLSDNNRGDVLSGPLDVVVVDPPRKGLSEDCLRSIISLAPGRIVYVSCNPATLARDLKYLASRGYRLDRVRPVDMFPRTVHVETVVLLSKGEIDSKKVRVEFSLEDMDMSGFQKGATYREIKAYVLEHSGLNVSNLYIAQVKQKCGIIERENYNLPKSENARQPKCPPEKEKAIRKAFEYFGMIPEKSE